MTSGSRTLEDSSTGFLTGYSPFSRLGSPRIVRPFSKPETQETRDDDWESWLRRYFAAHVRQEFAPHHRELWDWVWAIGRSSGRDAPQSDDGQPQDPAARAFAAIWARGGAKSTSAELACAAVGARATRRYALYVSRTQPMANRHVAAVSALFESNQFGRDFAKAGQRRIGKYGQSRSWTQTQLRMANGFACDAVSLEQGIRGAKDESRRPDLIILDDIDEPGDSPDAIAANLEAITRAILPTGAADCRVLVVQNLVHRDGFVARLHDGRADYLLDRHVSGPVPAVRDLGYERRPSFDGTTRYVITAGMPTWAGQSLAVCENQINDWGLQAFLEEAQHEVGAPLGGMFDHLDFKALTRPRELMPLCVQRIVVCDPAVTASDHSDSQAILSMGRAADDRIVVSRAVERIMSPGEAIRQGLEYCRLDGAGVFIVETDQGGDTWRSVYREECRTLGWVPHLDNEAQPVVGPGKVKAPQFQQVKAGPTQQGKAERLSQAIPDLEQGRVWFVEGSTKALTDCLMRFPKHKPYDAGDAFYHGWAHLRKPEARFAKMPAKYDSGYSARADELDPWARVKAMQEAGGRR